MTCPRKLSCPFVMAASSSLCTQTLLSTSLSVTRFTYKVLSIHLKTTFLKLRFSFLSLMLVSMLDSHISNRPFVAIEQPGISTLAFLNKQRKMAYYTVTKSPSENGNTWHTFANPWSTEASSFPYLTKVQKFVWISSSLSEGDRVFSNGYL